MSIVVEVDPVGVLYVRFGTAKVHRTVELIENALIVDLDDQDNVVGIEALKPGTLHLMATKIRPEMHLPSEAGKVDFAGLERSFAGMRI
ncbi:MAG: DUF2283 domain-containing protein [Planctomycetes bacterium]|nr:DUF2283 domain-containing protein [Planctomycetota bacterium]